MSNVVPFPRPRQGCPEIAEIAALVDQIKEGALFSSAAMVLSTAYREREGEDRELPTVKGILIAFFALQRLLHGIYTEQATA